MKASLALNTVAGVGGAHTPPPIPPPNPPLPLAPKAPNEELNCCCCCMVFLSTWEAPKFAPPRVVVEAPIREDEVVVEEEPWKALPGDSREVASATREAKNS